MRETPRALYAYERYYALGPNRSLHKLAEELVPQEFVDPSNPARTREQAVAAKMRQLTRWSAAHKWQERVSARIREEAQRVRERQLEEAEVFRNLVVRGIRADVSRYLQQLQMEGKSLAADSAADLVRLVELYFALVGQPIPRRVQAEHAGPDGGPLTQTIIARVLRNDEAREAASRLAAALAAGDTDAPDPSEDV